MGELTDRVREKIAALRTKEEGLGKREDVLKTYEQRATSGLYDAVKPHWKSAPTPAEGEGLPQYAERLTSGLTEIAKGVADRKADVEEAAREIEEYLKARE